LATALQDFALPAAGTMGGYGRSEMRFNPTYALTASGKLSRRDFMHRALAAGISVAAAQSMWHKAARAEQKKGGHMRLGLAGGSTTDSLDPRTYTDTFMLMIGYSVRGNLTEVVTAVSKAQLALQTATTIRDRMVQAYQQIMQMPI
jgi:hypothetical protein